MQCLLAESSNYIMHIDLPTRCLHSLRKQYVLKALLIFLCSIIPIVLILLIIKAFLISLYRCNESTVDETCVRHAAPKVQYVVVITTTFIQP